MKSPGQDADSHRSSLMARVSWWGTPVVLLAGLADAIALRWTCDDAFISFRYARNLLRGHGLVFNAGEAVEGYTNFLWTLGLAAGMGLGIDPIHWAWVFGLLAWSGVGGLLAWQAHRAERWPIAVWAWAAVPYGRMFATGGLETMSFALLATAAVWCAWTATGRRQGVIAGVLAGLALLSRPEGGLVIGTVAALTALRSWRHLPLVLAPVVVLVAPWLAFKMSFYGDLLPNTFYAKSSGGPRWADGANYLVLFFGSNTVLAVGLVAWLLPTREGQRGTRGGQWIIGAYLAIYLLHIARAGGDFMYARFCIPLVPFACMGLEVLFHEGRRRVPAVQWLGWLLPAAALLAPTPDALFGDVGEGGVGSGGIVDERSWYPPEAIELAKQQGAILAECVSQTPVRVAYYGTQAMLMYYADLPYALEPHVGLTDHTLARMPPPDESRVGHGQKADDSYLRSRNIDLVLRYRIQLPTTQITAISFPEGISGRLLSYRRPVVAQLRACGARVVDFEAFLDQWITQMDTADDSTVAKAYGSFSEFYFERNDDPVREAPFRNRLGLPPRAP